VKFLRKLRTNVGGDSNERIDAVDDIESGRSIMRLVEILEGRRQALRVREVANLLCVTPQHIYKMAASGSLPSLRISGAIRFDPQDLVTWLKARESKTIPPRPERRQSVAA
jgi:excisionase family DNA binding protein